MRKRAPNILIACSALLCLVNAVLWCRSYFVPDRLTYTMHNADGQWVVRRSIIKFMFPVTIAKAVEARSIGSSNGRITLSRIGFIIPHGQRLLQPGEPEPDYSTDFPYIGGERAGFMLEHPTEPWTPRDAGATRTVARYEHSSMLAFGYWAAPSWNTHAVEYEMHYWLVTALFAIAPAARLIKAVRRRRRFAAGHCPTCGYDLRATPNRCPECGAGGVSAAAGAVPAAQ